MQAGIIYIFGVAIIIAIAVLGLFVWGAHSGAFDKTEDAKYVLFRDDEEQEEMPTHPPSNPRHLP